MDFKSLLKSMDTISEGETTDTKTGKVHKGEYGNKYGKEDVRDQYGHKVGKKDKGAEAKKDAPKKGRGRPKKDTGETGEKFDTSALNNVFGGKKPKKEVGKVSKKHSLKEYMESVEDTKHAESVMEGMFGSTVDHSSVGNNLTKLARVIKSVQTPEQFAVAQKYAQRMSGTIMKHQHDNMGFGSGLRSNLKVMNAISSDLKAKAEELGIPYDPLAETQVNEVDPMNFDSDEDYYDAVRNSGRPRMSGGEMLDEIARLKSQLRYATTSSQRQYIEKQIDELENLYYGDDDLEEAEQIQIKPASQTQTQVIQQGNKTLGTVNNPQLAAQIKQSIGKGEMTLNPDEQKMAEGKDEGKPGKNFAKIAKSAGKQYGSKAAGERVAGAVRNKLKAQGKLEESDKKAKEDYDGDGKVETGKQEHKGAVTKAINKALGKDVKKDVKESRDHSSSEYTYENVAKILAREKPGLKSASDEFYSAVYHELIEMGFTPRAAQGKLRDMDFMGDTASAYVHYQENPTLDEGDIPRSASDSIRQHTQHALAEPTSNFTTQGQAPGSMAAPRGARTQINRPVPEPTPWGTDPIAAATDRAFNFVSSLGKGTKFTKEGTEMKDIQLESWEQQLNGLLTEGITVSSSTGQQGSPDSISVTATDNDAASLMSVLRNAGIGGFGAEPESPEIGYGVAQGGEEEPTGTGTEPQPSPDVVGDDGDMLSMLKKMAGLSAGPVSFGDEEGQDYEDEEGGEEAQDQTLEPADDGEETSGDVDSDEEGAEEGGEDEEGESGDDEEEQTDEGNAFTGKLKQTPQGGEFKMGDKSYKDTSSIEEGEEECNECGMMESQCGCDHVEESFANEAGKDGTAEQELAKLKALLSMGGDLHKMKHNQTVGNPTQVSMAESLKQWKKLSGIK